MKTAPERNEHTLERWKRLQNGMNRLQMEKSVFFPSTQKIRRNSYVWQHWRVALLNSTGNMRIERGNYWWKFLCMTPSITKQNPRPLAKSPFVDEVETWTQNHFFPIFSRNMHFWENFHVNKNILHQILHKNGSRENFGSDHFYEVTARRK